LCESRRIKPAAITKNKVNVFRRKWSAAAELSPSSFLPLLPRGDYPSLRVMCPFLGDLNAIYGLGVTLLPRELFVTLPETIILQPVPFEFNQAV